MPPRRKSKPEAVADPSERPVVRTGFTERATPAFDPRTVVDILMPIGPRHVEAMKRAVRSVEAQTVPFWRIICINDTGRDIASEIPRDDIVLINNTGAHGSSYARNLGLDVAKAPFVLFLDADDWLLNTTLELYLKAYTLLDTGYIYGDAIVMNAPDGVAPYHPRPEQLAEHPQYDRTFYTHHNQHIVTALIPTSLARDVRFDETINIWEDYDFYAHMAAKGYCGTRINYPAIVYNWSEGTNRETGNYMDSPDAQGRAGVLTARIREKWKGEIERGRMACCGAGQNEQERARQALRNSINPQVAGDVPMEWLGRNGGSVRYNSPNNTGRAYDVSMNLPHRFFSCDPRDVEWMKTLGAREQPKPSVPIVIPSTSEFVAVMRVPPNERMTSANENTVVVPPLTDDEFKEI